MSQIKKVQKYKKKKNHKKLKSKKIIILRSQIVISMKEMVVWGKKKNYENHIKNSLNLEKKSYKKLLKLEENLNETI